MCIRDRPEDAQAARDLADQCERFEKKLYDLELTRNIIPFFLMQTEYPEAPLTFFQLSFISLLLSVFEVSPVTFPTRCV